MNIDFVSRGTIKKLIVNGEISSEKVAIISISDTSYEYTEMREMLDGYNFHAFCFHDTEDYKGMSPIQAEQMLKFIQKNHDKDFLIHCFAGISRSGAVAKFINEFYDAGNWYLEDYKGYNRRVYNKLLAAADMSLGLHTTKN